MNAFGWQPLSLSLFRRMSSRLKTQTQANDIEGPNSLSVENGKVSHAKASQVFTRIICDCCGLENSRMLSTVINLFTKGKKIQNVYLMKSTFYRKELGVK